MAEQFNINELIYRVNLKNSQNTTEDENAKFSYKEVLDKIQHTISTNHSGELAQVLYSPEAEKKLKNLIIRYLNIERLSVEGIDNISELTDRIYNDMAGLGILSKYLYDPEVEEININRHNGIEVVYPDRIFYPKERFNNEADCMDKIKKMVRLGGVVIDGSKPFADSYLSNGVRISAMISPCVDADTGGVASIRKQKTHTITKEMMLGWGTVTEDELNFLNLCINNGISVAVAGATGSGKTTDLTYLLTCIDKQKRIYTIEDTRELNIIEYDNEGYMTNRVIHTVTKDGPNHVTSNDLLKESLRFHPDYIVPAEMRGSEAMTAQEAGRTGHTILTTLHANDAKLAYRRILTMCMMAGTGLSENLLLDFILEAWPIVVFKKQLPDKSRKYMQIFEGTGHKDGQIIGNMIFQFQVTKNERDEDGRLIKVHGEHKRVGNISNDLAYRLISNGADINEVKKYISADLLKGV